MMRVPTPVTAEEALDVTTNEGLLKAYAALTHRIHVRQEPGLRAQRDLIEAEILRRMDGATS